MSDNTNIPATTSATEGAVEALLIAGCLNAMFGKKGDLNVLVFPDLITGKKDKETGEFLPVILPMRSITDICDGIMEDDSPARTEKFCSMQVPTIPSGGAFLAKELKRHNAKFSDFVLECKRLFESVERATAARGSAGDPVKGMASVLCTLADHDFVVPDMDEMTDDEVRNFVIGRLTDKLEVIKFREILRRVQDLEKKNGRYEASGQIKTVNRADKEDTATGAAEVSEAEEVKTGEEVTSEAPTQE